MPMGKYPNFASCVKANSSKANPQAYCATIMRATEGKRNYSAKAVEMARRKA